uniref:Putative methyltransferase n=1 Tax=viral metagenome TaxID=1070528 RepID=A0A6H1ZIH7_9ZZZZ
MNEIIKGDCLEVMKDIPDKSIDMILCDLPYGTTACKWDTIIPFEPLWDQYKRIIKDNGAIVLTASQPFTSALVMSNIKVFRYEIIWEKERPTNIFFMKKQIGRVHENILVFYKHQPTYNPEMTEREFDSKGEVVGNIKSSRTHKNQNYKHAEDYNHKVRYPRSVLKINRNNQKNIHPTQKPVALFEYLIKTYTNEGDLVLDNCAGSGTTGVACKKLKRNYILIEKEQEYVDIARARIKSMQDTLI